ncbi:MAG TPA: photosystem II reaction center protein J [Patescibacteria group bacterium]|nr:photosystem II reaction center protein J [Patescibacteria group bacterium]
MKEIKLPLWIIISIIAIGIIVYIAISVYGLYFGKAMQY